jgi:hypothetical protein
MDERVCMLNAGGRVCVCDTSASNNAFVRKHKRRIEAYEMADELESTETNNQSDVPKHRSIVCCKILLYYSDNIFKPRSSLDLRSVMVSVSR